MLKGNELNEGDTFYYALSTYKNDGSVEFITMAYEFHRKWHECFDENLMFATEKEAEAKVKELNKVPAL